MAKIYPNTGVTTQVKDYRDSWRTQIKITGFRKRPIWQMVMKGGKPRAVEHEWPADQIKETTHQPILEQAQDVQPDGGRFADVYKNILQMYYATTSLGRYMQIGQTASGDNKLAYQLRIALEVLFQQQELSLLGRVASKKPTAALTGTMGSVLNYIMDKTDNYSTGLALGTNKGGYNSSTEVTRAIDVGSGGTGGTLTEDDFNRVLRKVNEAGVNAQTYTCITTPAMFATIGAFSTNNQRYGEVAQSPGPKGGSISNYVGIYWSSNGFKAELMGAPFQLTYTRGSDTVHDAILVDRSQIQVHNGQGLMTDKFGFRGPADSYMITCADTVSIGDPSTLGALVNYKPSVT